MNFINKLFTLEGKVAIVTGGANGNGKAMASAMAQAGAKVFIGDKCEESLLQLNEFEEFKSTEKLYLDVASKASIEEFLENSIRNIGKLDILINNAGITRHHSNWDFPEKLWDETIAINLKGQYLMTQCAAPFMIKQKSGSIINITSLMSEVALPNNPAYGAAKGGLKQLSKCYALDLGKYGIRVNNIGPGYFHTGLTHKTWSDESKTEERRQKTIIGRWGVPEDLSGIAVFLASDASSYIYGSRFLC